MPAPSIGSTVPRRQLGRELTKLRNLTGMSQRKAAKELEWSEPKLWRIEHGLTSLRSLDVKNMCELYGADQKLTEALMALAKETKSRGWWHAYGDVIPRWFEVYVGLEAAASRLLEYQPELVPGMLQTEEYATAVLRTADNPSEADIKRQLKVRLGRQRVVVLEDQPEVAVILNEAVLRRPVGGPEVMAAQLGQLCSLSERKDLSLRVVPFAAGAHGSMLGSFTILEFPNNGEPDTVYVEELTGALYLDKAEEVAAYHYQFERLLEHALDEDQTRDLMTTCAKEYEREA